MLYISIATTNPLAVRLCVSSRASQQATPSASNAAPATRASITAADVPSGEPSSSRTTTEGTAINPSPVAASRMAVSLSKRFMAFGEKGRRHFGPPASQIGVGGWLVRGFGDRICCGLLLLCCHLRRAKLDSQLVNRAGELERQLVAVVHARACVQADIEVFINGHDQRNRVCDFLAGQLLAIHREYSGATLARAGAVVFE